MDPVSVVGLAASVLQIATYSFTAIQALERLRARYTNAPATIEGLYAESKLINALLSQLRATFNDKDNVLAVSLRNNKELASALDDVLSGCHAVYMRLDAELQNIVASPLDNQQKFSLRRRTSLLFKEDILRSYLSQVHGHQTALTLLIQGLQMHSLSDIHKVVRQTQSILESNQEEAQKAAMFAQQAGQLPQYEKSPQLDHSMPIAISGPVHIPSPNLGPVQSPSLRPIPSPTLRPISSPVSTASTMSATLPMTTPPSAPLPPIPFPNVPSGPLQTQTSLPEVAERPRAVHNAPEMMHEMAGPPSRVDSLIDFSDPPVIVRTPVDEPLSRTLRELNNLSFDQGAWESRDLTHRGDRDSVQSYLTLSTVSSPAESESRFSRLRGNSGDSNRPSPHILDQPDLPELPVNKLNRTDSLLTVATAEDLQAFPKIQNPPEILPPVVEDEIAAVFSKRERMLLSTDASQQLTWAEDVLRLLFRNNRHRERANRGKSEPTIMPPEEQMLRTAAREVIEARSGQGLAKALFLKAKWLETTAERAREAHLVALAKGYLRSAYYVGQDYERRKENATALGYYRQGVDGQDGACLYRMGLCNLRAELGMKKDHSNAIPLLRSAARRSDKDFPEPLFLLGTLHTKAYRSNFKISKSNLPIDDDAARENFLQAARLGHAGAQLKIGMAYQSGQLSCTPNPALSMHYLRLAAHRGEAEADLELSTWFWWGAPPVIEANHKLAYVYARRAADDSLVAAYSQVGYFFEQGLGVKQDYPKAKEWYLKGAAVGDKVCARRLDALLGRTGKNILGSST